MLFNSLPYIFLFLPIVFFTYIYLNKKGQFRGSIIWILLGSLFFYGYWNIHYLPILLISIVVNFSFGRYLAKDDVLSSRRLILVLGILFNVLLLIYFKYMSFFATNINWLIKHQSVAMRLEIPFDVSMLSLGPVLYRFGIKSRRTVINIAIPLLALFIIIAYCRYSANILIFLQAFFNNIHAKSITLPIGISFFTFTQIAYLVDVYKKGVREYNLLNYATFVSYFPHLLAGPIIHHAEMMPQFISKENKRLSYHNVYKGLVLFTIGLFKKVIIADTFAIWANSGYAHIGHLGFIQAWLTTFAYTFQLYFDFSGYTDMAIGVSLMFNIILPINFNSPYKSLNIREFWRRWHITLGRFLKNYLYIFLGGNRVGELKLLRNFMVVFLIGGMWHGAGWTFIIWGAMHGAGMVIHKLWEKTKIVMPKYVAWFVTFMFVNFAWVFFRAKSVTSAVTLIKECVSFVYQPNVNMFLLMLVVFGFILSLFFKNSNTIMDGALVNKKMSAFIFSQLFLIAVSIIIIRNSSAFLYFQF